MTEKLRRSNGTVTERAHLRTDKKKFEDGWDRVFGSKKEESKEDEAQHKDKLEVEVKRNTVDDLHEQNLEFWEKTCKDQAARISELETILRKMLIPDAFDDLEGKSQQFRNLHPELWNDALEILNKKSSHQ